MTIRMRVGVSLILMLLCASSFASASPITIGTSATPLGTFEWVYDTYFDFTSTFKVTNESGDSFEDIFVDLYGPDALDPIRSVYLGTLDAGADPLQSFVDIVLSVPDQLDRAHLRFTLGADASLVTADLFAAALTGETPTFAATVDFFAPEPQPVPEQPSTLLLLSSALGALGLRRKAWRSRAARRGSSVAPTPPPDLTA